MDENPAYHGLRDRDYFHIMLNLDSFDGFLPTARALAERFLAAARARQQAGDIDPLLRPFVYSRQAYRDRLDQVYQRMGEQVSRYEASQGWLRETRDDMVRRLRQLAPLNQTDGCWLRTIAPTGPMDEVRALLFTIYTEELGNGKLELNHANMYTELLRGVGVELPDIRSQAYADEPSLLDEAFALPLLQLVVSQFPQDFFPELLGMTQYFEWSSLELKQSVLQCQHLGLDPGYFEMHVAIDNASTGHGAMARRAVELYLEQVRVDAGDETMAEQWRRVWDGYVAFATTGELGAAMARPASGTDLRTPADEVREMIANRADRARLNHGSRKLAGRPLNDLFADPAALMTALIEGKMIVPGDPDASPFFSLLTADGPMYKVFDDAETATWREWVRSIDSPIPLALP